MERGWEKVHKDERGNRGQLSPVTTVLLSKVSGDECCRLCSLFSPAEFSCYLFSWAGLVLRKGILLSSQELILQISSRFKLDFAGKNKSFIGKKQSSLG
jgi:hypothetical protein